MIASLPIVFEGATPTFNDVNEIDTTEDVAAEAEAERAHKFTAYE